MFAFLFRFVLHTLLGWKLKPGSEPIPTERCLVFSYPHTSFLDALLIACVTSGYTGRLLAKSSGVGLLLTKLFGAAGVKKDQSAVGGQTDAVAKGLNKPLYMSPEGTRKYAGHIRSGFYHIARKAGDVPIVCGNFDYRTREYSFSKPIDVGEKSIAEVLASIRAHYDEHKLLKSGRYPVCECPLALKPQKDI